MSVLILCVSSQAMRSCGTLRRNAAHPHSLTVRGYMEQNTGEHAPRLRTAMVTLSFIVSFSALFFAFEQSRIANRGVEAQIWQQITQQGNDISRIFIDHPNLRPYFYDDKPIDRNDPNFQAVMPVCELYLDYIDSMQDEYVFALPGMGINGENRVLWDRYFKDMFASSPALRAYAIEKKFWYSPGEFDEYMPKEKYVPLIAPQAVGASAPLVQETRN